jgi:hypothetical protein
MRFGDNMLCERCGYEIGNDYHRSICPACGTLLPKKAETQPSSSIGSSPQARIYAGRSARYPSGPASSHTTAEIQSTAPHEEHFSKKDFSQQGTSFTPGGVNFFPLRSSEHILILEFVLSLVGVFGIGWMLAGQTIIGLILLACSILLYWPIMFLGTLFTIGLSLLCVGPFVFGAIICNAFLLNRYLKHKAQRLP